MLHNLDWTTSARAADLTQHRRFLQSQAVATVLSLMAWWGIYPNTFWFIKLWAAITTGIFIGSVLGSIWQLGNAARVPATSGRLLVSTIAGSGLMAGLSMVMFRPAFHAEELALAHVRALSKSSIRSITVCSASATCRDISREQMSAFLRQTQSAILFYRSHEASSQEFRIELHFADGSTEGFSAAIPERHPADVALDCDGCLAGEVLIPGARL